MFLGLSNKTLAISGGLAGLTAGGISIAYLTSNNSKIEKLPAPSKKTLNKAISTLLNDNGLKLLEKSDDVGVVAKWKQKWDAFKPKYPSLLTNGDWVLEEWESKHKQAEQAPIEFKTKCEENSQKEVENIEDPLYIAVKDYCTETKPSGVGV